jgi:hypothetical protein
MNNCKLCGKETKNKYFCSLGCGTTFRERENRKIRLEEYLENPNLCKKCGEPILPKENEKICDTKKRLCCSSKCYSHPKRNGKRCPYCDTPIGKNSNSCKRHRTSNISLKQKKDFRTDKDFHSKIRDNSRKEYKKSGQVLVCFSCGYSKFVEICHKKDIHSFSEESFIFEINHIDNLVALCPNCHWEFDHNMLKI